MRLTLTEKSETMFLKLARDAGNWGGTPMISVTRSERGNVGDLVKKNLISVFDYEGNTFAKFTEAGKSLASVWNIEI